MKKLVLKFFNFFGFDLTRKRDIYEIKLYNNNYDEQTLKNKRFYNIGAGSFNHPYWTNIDYSSDWYSAVQSDYINFNLFSLDKLPIEDGIAKNVYTSHTIEHINDEAAQNIFNETYRILEKNGIFRIITPNIELEYRAMKDNDLDYFFWIDSYSVKKEIDRVKITKPMNQASIQQIFLYHFASQTSTLHYYDKSDKINDEEFDKIFSTMEFQDALNYCTTKCLIDIQNENPGNHLNWWSFDKVSRMLEKAGFKTKYIFKSGYGQSFSPVMRNINLFDNTHPKISLYVEAIKD
ncbi:MAG: hypothetical protein HeimC2_18290 [Candidatus Heimdallarchaeota archaeon LC_2]|nr:MAG: hypothetical protein HeimC2_18290 [Candidatus Heimdallarchaeota archaeon LC_2]